MKIIWEYEIYDFLRYFAVLKVLRLQKKTKLIWKGNFFFITVVYRERKLGKYKLPRVFDKENLFKCDSVGSIELSQFLIVVCAILKDGNQFIHLVVNCKVISLFVAKWSSALGISSENIKLLAYLVFNLSY